MMAITGYHEPVLFKTNVYNEEGNILFLKRKRAQSKCELNHNFYIKSGTGSLQQNGGSIEHAFCLILV